MTCLPGLALSAADQKCYSLCGPGLFPLGDGCSECHETCATCTGAGPTNCLSCPPALDLYPPNNSCLDQCPDGFYDLEGTCYRKSETD